MNSLRIVKNAEGVNGVMLNNHSMLMVEETEEQKDGYLFQKYYMYNIEKNTKIEIAPKIPKYNIIKISDIEKYPSYIYFSNYDIREDDTIEIRIFRYSLADNICKKIYSIEEEYEKFKESEKIKVFVLNEFYMIIQKESLRDNLAGNYSDYLDFELFLYNIIQDETIQIVDQNLVTNGISDIKLVSENICVLKTGYSLIIDKRYEKLEKEEVSVEGISFVNLGQLVSDIIISKNNIVLDTIEHAFYNATIPYIKVQGDYLVYSLYNFDERTEKVVFYNYQTKESQICLNKNEATDFISLAKTIVFNNRPYLRVEGDEGMEFYNISDKKVDFIFKNDAKYEAAIKDIIVGSVSKKKLFGKKRTYFNVYKYPGLSLVHSEKGRFIGCVADGEGKIYVLTKKG